MSDLEYFNYFFTWTAVVLPDRIDSWAETLKPCWKNSGTLASRLFPHNNMEYYGHTADDENGRRLPESNWQLLRDHLRNVAELAKQFAEPMGLAQEAELAGLLHDLGKP